MRLRWVRGGVLLLGAGASVVVVLAYSRSTPAAPDTVVAVVAVHAPPSGSPSSRSTTSQPPLTQVQLFEIAERRRLGLDSSPNYVRGLDGQKLPPSWMNIRLTAAELEEFERRTRVGLSFGRVEKLMKKRAPTTFGGIWLDHEAGGVAVVATTDRASLPLADVRALLPADAAIRVETVQNSEASLRQMHAELIDDWTELETLKINALRIGLHVRENIVEVRLASKSPESDVDRFLQRYGYSPTLRVRIQEAQAGFGSGAMRDCGIAAAVKAHDADARSRLADEYLGLTVEQAKVLASTRNFEVRTVGSDGDCFATTADLKFNRVSLYLTEGRVTAAGIP